MSDKYQLEEVKDYVLWNTTISKTKQYTVFSNTNYLLSCGVKFKLYFVKKGIIIRAGLCVLIDDNSNIILDDLVIYSGIFFCDFGEHKLVKKRSEYFEITEFLINFLNKEYNDINIALSPFIEDLRPFLWHNYILEDSHKFKLDLRYTSYLDISSLQKFSNEEETWNFKNLEVIRQRNIRKARNNNIITVDIKEQKYIETFLINYKLLMESQGETVKDSKLNNMKNTIIESLNGGYGAMFVTTNANKEVLYTTIFIFDDKRAYYLFGAGELETREYYKGTICFWDAYILLAQKYKIREVDLEGINSPKRGWFKLSFGGNILPYYEIHYKGNKR